MAKYTTNYNLTKPDENENYDVEIFNDNADTVDTELKKVNDALANKADASSVVTSVAGKTGAVTLTKSDVSLNNVDNTADTAKPISTAMQTALDKKVDTSKVLTDVPANAVFTDTKYTAGNNVSISEENVISATNTTYTEISTNEIDEGTSSTLRLITGRRMKHALDKKADASKVLTDVPANAEFTDTKYTAGSNVAISEANVVSATDTKYSEITTTEIDDGTSSTLRAITGRRMKHALDKKVNTDQVLTPVPADAKFTDTKYSAGTNVSISGTTISATDTVTTINGKTGAIAKADITALGIPGQDTTYGDASTTAKGLVKLSTATDSTSTTLAATPSAVKAAYDRADAAFTSASNGKTAIGAAITGVDSSVVIPTDPTFAELATAIGQISSGKKWASGVTSDAYIIVNGLSFRPSIVLAKNSTGYTAGGHILVSVYADKTVLGSEVEIALYTRNNAGYVYDARAAIEIRSGGFTLPNGGVATTYAWIAFE